MATVAWWRGGRGSIHQPKAAGNPPPKGMWQYGGQARCPGVGHLRNKAEYPFSAPLLGQSFLEVLSLSTLEGELGN